jgi:hypothetical protein
MSTGTQIEAIQRIFRGIHDNFSVEDIFIISQWIANILKYNMFWGQNRSVGETELDFHS